MKTARSRAQVMTGNGGTFITGTWNSLGGGGVRDVLGTAEVPGDDDCLVSLAEEATQEKAYKIGQPSTQRLLNSTRAEP